MWNVGLLILIKSDLKMSKVVEAEIEASDGRIASLLSKRGGESSWRRHHIVFTVPSEGYIIVDGK